MPTAIITGASRGVGKAIAKALAKDGFNVVVCYNQSKRQALELVAELSQDNVWAKAIKVDVRKEDEVHALILDVIKTFGSIDALINNAGVQMQRLVQETSLSQWNDMLNVCLTGAFLTIREAVPYMLNGGGCIVNIGSMWGEVGASMESAYSAAKGGLFALTKALAKELAPSKIRVNALSLGVIDTDMTAVFDQQTIEQLQDSTLLQRLGTTNDVANAVSFLVSQKAAYITGEIIRVNGGFIL